MVQQIIVRGLNANASITAAQGAAETASDAASIASSASSSATAARTAAQAAETAAEAARAAAEALVISDLGTTDGQTRALIEAPASQTAQALATTIATTAESGDITTVRLGDGAGDIDLINQQTVPGLRCLQVLPVEPDQGTGLVLIAGPDTDPAGLKTQILLYGANDVGNVNYDRFGISALATNSLVIDSTYGGSGVARDITFQMGGSAAAAATTVASGSNGATLPQGTINVASTAGFLNAGTLQIGANQVAYTGKTGTTFTGCTGGTGTLSTSQAVYGLVHGQNAVVIYADASVDLNGGTKTIDGKTFGSTRARVADPMDTGATQLIIDTRTLTGTNNATDSAVISYGRGGASKWSAGLNYAGSNSDSFDFYDRVNGAARLQILQSGELLVSGDAPSNYGGVLRLVNTGASGHSWRIGEFGGAGTLAFRDTTSGNYPLQLGAAGGAGFWGHTPPATQPATPATLADVIAILRGCGLAA